MLFGVFVAVDVLSLWQSTLHVVGIVVVTWSSIGGSPHHACGAGLASSDLLPTPNLQTHDTSPTEHGSWPFTKRSRPGLLSTPLLSSVASPTVVPFLTTATMEALLSEHARLESRGNLKKSIDDVQRIIDLLETARASIVDGKDPVLKLPSLLGVLMIPGRPHQDAVSSREATTAYQEVI